MATPARGRRETKKEDKRKRIQAAASRLFRMQGYDETTTRAIAEEAGIATGTLFLYVRDKDEALVLVYGDDVDAALARPRDPRRRRFASALAHRLRALYELYARHPDLALRYVRRIPTLEDTEKAAHDARNARFIGVIRDEVERAIASRELRGDLDVDLAVRTLFAVIRVLLFSWLAAPPVSLEAGQRDLEATLALLVAGMGA
jgi:AcrR family transcriptional regulator